MKKEYVKPELEIIELAHKTNLLNGSDPEGDIEFNMVFPKDETNVG